jgi:hypothetical protein
MVSLYGSLSQPASRWVGLALIVNRYSQRETVLADAQVSGEARLPVGCFRDFVTGRLN